MAKKSVTLFIAIFVFISGNIGAIGRKHGDELMIQKRDGLDVRGELIAVKQNSLLLLESDSSADVSVGISDTVESPGHLRARMKSFLWKENLNQKSKRSLMNYGQKPDFQI